MTELENKIKKLVDITNDIKNTALKIDIFDYYEVTKGLNTFEIMCDKLNLLRDHFRWFLNEQKEYLKSIAIKESK